MLSTSYLIIRMLNNVISCVFKLITIANFEMDIIMTVIQYSRDIIVTVTNVLDNFYVFYVIYRSTSTEVFRARCL